MTKQNLSIVFGPTLFGQGVPDPGTELALNGMAGMADASSQNLVRLIRYQVHPKLTVLSRLWKLFLIITPISLLNKRKSSIRLFGHGEWTMLPFRTIYPTPMLALDDPPLFQFIIMLLVYGHSLY